MNDVAQLVRGTEGDGALSHALIFQNNLWSEYMKTRVDSYEAMAICAAVRTGVPQLTAFREALEGKRAFSAQVRLALEFVRRGYLSQDDLETLGARNRKAQP